MKLYNSTDYSTELLQKIEQLASQLTPPTEMSFLLGIDERILKMDLSIPDSPARKAFFTGFARTANELRCNNITLANAGSPAALVSCLNDMHNMITDLDQ